LRAVSLRAVTLRAVTLSRFVDAGVRRGSCPESLSARLSDGQSGGVGMLDAWT